MKTIAMLDHNDQGCISCLTCSYPELTEDHVLTSAYVKIFRTVTRNAVNKSVWRKKDCFWLPLNKHAMNVWLSSLRIRAHLSWRTGKHLHVLHVLRTYSTCSYPGYQDTTTYAALVGGVKNRWTFCPQNFGFGQPCGNSSWPKLIFRTGPNLDFSACHRRALCPQLKVKLDFTWQQKIILQ